MRGHDSKLTQALINFMLTFPMPNNFKKILEKQVASAEFTIEHYHDCFKILFTGKENVEAFPMWTPTLLQSCQLLKDSGPFVCQLFVEEGYVVQFEVVDMGLNRIDWDCFWRLIPIFDIEYDLRRIKNQLELDKVHITSFWKSKTSASFVVDINGCRHTVQLNNCTIQAFPTAGILCDCRLQLYSKWHAEPPYSLVSDDGKIDIICSLVGMQKRL